ncbi:MAG: hypothetical protein H6Q58_528 [Firmicutes bacterium]|nr:hypothetical protein [Bacillota bacterium]
MILTISSAAVYTIQNLIFHQPENTFFYMFQDLAFVPVQVAIVTFVINRFLNLIEQRKKNKKINVIISTFFTEAGMQIMTAMTEFNGNQAELSKIIKINDLKKNNENQVKKTVVSFKYDIYAEPKRLDMLAALLEEKKPFMLSLLENSNLLEHDSFTDMIWAVFHVADELQNRGELRSLPKADVVHLSNDLLRAYPALIQEWVGYMAYLRDEYPFLYEAAKKRSPFCQPNQL